MYEELVKRLREVIPWECPLTCKNTMHEAADAIEELQGRAKVLEKVADKWCETVPKWIPVTERLPNPTFAREWYLVALESGCVTTLGFERETMQWHITGSPVAYWMPIPEPPKEGK